MRTGCWTACLLTFCLASSPHAQTDDNHTNGGGIIPESGAFWNPARSGEGAFLEVQGNKAAITLFTYDLKGRSTFYFAAGEFILAPGYISQAIPGLNPVRLIDEDLFQTENGPLFNTGNNMARDTNAVKVGKLLAEFSTHEGVVMKISLYDPPEGSNRDGLYVLSRYNFGFDQFGTSITESYKRSCWPDLRGEWVFIDQTAPERPPWRFNFTTLDITPPPQEIVCRQPASSPPQILVYTDPDRGATLRCVYASSDNPDPLDGKAKLDCELRVEGIEEPLFWFSHEDMGLKRISASLGPSPGPTVLRTKHRVVGLRVE